MKDTASRRERQVSQPWHFCWLPQKQSGVCEPADAEGLHAERIGTTFHTLRHAASSRMIAAGLDDYTVMAINGH